MHRINCKYSDKTAYCTNKNIKRSLFGLGARLCVEYPSSCGVTCKYKEKFPKPPITNKGK